VPLWEGIRDNLLAYAMVAAAAGVAVLPLVYWIWPPRLLPLQRLRTGRWSGSAVCVAFFLFISVPGLTADLLEEIGFFQGIFVQPPSPMRKGIWSSPLYTPLMLALLFWVLFAGSRTRPADLGMTRARWPQNTVLGYLSFVVWAPLVLGLYFAIQLVLGEFFDALPEVHPLDELSKEPLTTLEWALIFFMATIAAALLEEVVFRGVFQGWLRRASLGGHVVVMVVTLLAGLYTFLTPFFKTPDGMEETLNPGPLIFALVLVLGYICAFYWLWSPVGWQRQMFLADDGDDALAEKMRQAGFSDVVLPSLGRPSEGRQPALNNARLAIFGSAMLFAACHPVWPTPIPLFPLGLGLGYLAYRTQSLVPGIVMHCLFNTVACIELVLNHG
jgi:membrane protease YdiL (CAAX protease family)